jgi:hypothetical protein
MDTEDPNPPSWIERRYLRERLLKDGSRPLWDEIRAAFQDACTTFHERFDGNSECILENGRRVRITRNIPVDPVTRTPARSIHLLVEFVEAPPAVVVTGDASARRFPFESDDAGIFILDKPGGKNRFTPDGLSQAVLERVFFPE